MYAADQSAMHVKHAISELSQKDQNVIYAILHGHNIPEQVIVTTGVVVYH